MRVLHLTAGPVIQAIASFRLHKGLLKIGCDSLMGTKGESVWLPGAIRAPEIIDLRRTGPGRGIIADVMSIVNRVTGDFFPNTGHFFPPSFSAFPLKRIFEIDPDIIHLHWIAPYFLSVSALGKINLPVVWTLHDTWAFTGGCRITTGCRRFENKCGHCPQLIKGHAFDASRIMWYAKRRAYRKMQPHIVTPSKRFYDMAHQSSLLATYPIRRIPIGVDTQNFAPFAQAKARDLLGLPKDACIVLFGAVSLEDKNKGYDFLQSALNHLKGIRSCDDIHCAIFGASNQREDLPFPVHYLGWLNDTTSLRLAYNAADVFVCPSREENFPQVVLEASACGLPVVAFSVGGEIIEHKESGYIALQDDPGSLSEGLLYVLSDGSRRKLMGCRAREIVLQNFAMDKIAKQYKNLYAEILAEKKT